MFENEIIPNLMRIPIELKRIFQSYSLYKHAQFK